MKYVSYYGLCLAFATPHHDKALELCRKAAATEFYNPDIFWNLGRVALLAGNRGEAHSTFLRGLEMDPDHPGLRFQVRRLGLRRRPVLPFLGRGHRLNRWAGRVRRQLAR
ncbi:MAG: tetratricopeptide repeat protein [Acidobacteriota bacterium]